MDYFWIDKKIILFFFLLVSGSDMKYLKILLFSKLTNIFFKTCPLCLKIFSLGLTL